MNIAAVLRSRLPGHSAAINEHNDLEKPTSDASKRPLERPSDLLQQSETH